MPWGCVARGVIVRGWGREAVERVKGGGKTGDRGGRGRRPARRAAGAYFFPASMASPFLQATILIFGAETSSFDSILNVGLLTMNVHTSSHRR